MTFTSQPSSSPTPIRLDASVVSNQERARISFTVIFLLIFAMYFSRRCYLKYITRRAQEEDQAVDAHNAERMNPILNNQERSYDFDRRIFEGPFSPGRIAINTREVCNNECPTCIEFANANLPGNPCYCSLCHKNQIIPPKMAKAIEGQAFVGGLDCNYNSVTTGPGLVVDGTVLEQIVLPRALATGDGDIIFNADNDPENAQREVQVACAESIVIEVEVCSNYRVNG